GLPPPREVESEIVAGEVPPVHIARPERNPGNLLHPPVNPIGVQTTDQLRVGFEARGFDPEEQLGQPDGAGPCGHVATRFWAGAFARYWARRASCMRSRIDCPRRRTVCMCARLWQSSNTFLARTYSPA